MKKSILLLAMTCLFGGTIFTSCNDDDNDNTPIIDPVVYTANFTGITETTLNSGHAPMTFPGTPGQKVIITRDTLDRTVLIYKDWTGMGTNYGDFSIPVSLTSTDNGQIGISGDCIQTLYKDSKGYEATLGVTGKIFSQAIIDGEGRKDSCSLLITVNMPVSPTKTLDFLLDYKGITE